MFGRRKFEDLVHFRIAALIITEYVLVHVDDTGWVFSPFCFFSASSMSIQNCSSLSSSTIRGRTSPWGLPGYDTKTVKILVEHVQPNLIRVSKVALSI